MVKTNIEIAGIFWQQNISSNSISLGQSLQKIPLSKNIFPGHSLSRTFSFPDIFLPGHFLSRTFSFPDIILQNVGRIVVPYLALLLLILTTPFVSLFRNAVGKRESCQRTKTQSLASRRKLVKQKTVEELEKEVRFVFPRLSYPFSARVYWHCIYLVNVLATVMSISSCRSAKRGLFDRSSMIIASLDYTEVWARARCWWQPGLLRKDVWL